MAEAKAGTGGARVPRKARGGAKPKTTRAPAAKPVASKGLLSDRLLAMLQAEIGAVEAALAGADPVAGDESAAEVGRGAGTKARIDSIGGLVRILEKLLDLRRLEQLTERRDDAGDEAEAARLRDELMRRLRLLDARRAGEKRLFCEAEAPNESSSC